MGTIAAVTAVVGGAGAASAALWYYSRRYSSVSYGFYGFHQSYKSTLKNFDDGM